MEAEVAVAFKKWAAETNLFDLVTSKPLYRHCGVSPKMLLSPTLSQTARQTQLIDVHDGMMLADVVVQLSALDVLYLPVYRLEEFTDNNGHAHVPNYLYWVSAVEVIKYIQARQDGNGNDDDDDKDDKDDNGDSDENDDNDDGNILRVTISEVHDVYLPSHKWIPFEMLSCETSLEKLMQRWRDSDSLHYLPPYCTVAGMHGLQVVTPTDLLRYFSLVSGQKFPSLTNDLIMCSQVLPGQKDYVRGSLHEPALVVFGRMVRAASNIAGIIDDKGVLVMHLSAQDALPVVESTEALLASAASWLRSLHLPLFSFVTSRSYKSTSMMVHGLDVFSTKADVSLGQIVRKMLTHSVHQLWRRDAATSAYEELVGVQHVIRFLTALLSSE